MSQLFQSLLGLVRMATLLAHPLLELQLLVLLHTQGAGLTQHTLKVVRSRQLCVQRLNFALELLLVLFHLYNRLFNLSWGDELRLRALRSLVHLLELLLQVLVLLVNLEDLLVAKHVLWDLYCHEETCQVRTRRQLRALLEHPGKHRVDDVWIAMQKPILEVLWVDALLVIEHLEQKIHHPVGRRLRRFVAQVCRVRRGDLSDKRVDNLE
mmetsp:Transcript_21875/g.66401  ORF Transcript_21875/g.66401 Transcript_21875/m.66401 type:complete len:210 (-) Transcript_21875:151-780(-)